MNDQPNGPTPSKAAVGAAELRLDERIVSELTAALPQVAQGTIAAVMAEVPTYAGALTGRMGENVTGGVEVALGTLLTLLAAPDGTDPSAPLAPALDAAYDLGRVEARYGRSVDALLSAYRIGARVAWRDFSALAAQQGIDVATLAAFAELVFAYIDELSAASVAGHSYEMAGSERDRQRRLDALVAEIVDGASRETLEASAERAQWPLPTTLTAVLLPPRQLRAVGAALPPRTLSLEDGFPGLGADADRALLLVPEADGPGRRQLFTDLRGHDAIVGPSRPWHQAAESVQRAFATISCGIEPESPGAPIDTEQHLARLAASSDPGALADLRTQVLSPLADLPPATAERLAETLCAWVLHRGRRDAVAQELVVHPQTVRYRMGQLRDLYGSRLDDPQMTIDVVVALAYRPPSD